MCIPVGATCHSWAGFMQMAVKGSKHDINRIDVLPFINVDPTRPDTIYSALSYVQTLCEKQQLGIAPDQPLFIKASEMVHSSFDFARIVSRLGGFHLIMSYMGAIGAVMRGSGIAECLEFMHLTLISGHAYVCATRAHLLTSAALVTHIPNTFTIRREDEFWSGNFTDQTIEQFLMRMLKVSGGLAHGRGITDSTQTK